MAKSRAEIQRAYRARRRAAVAAVAGKSDAALLPVQSLGVVRDFCSALGTLGDWDDGNPRAIANAHDKALALALQLLGLSEDGNAGNAAPEK